MEREKRLILEGSPCYNNYFNRELLTVDQAIMRGKEPCPNLEECNTESKDIYCLLRSGLEIAQYVVKGSTLEKELGDFSQAEFLEEECRDSRDRKKFEIIKGKAKVLAAVERFARTILLMNPLESSLPRCGECMGVKLTKELYDSIHDGPFPLSGSGRTKRRSVEYCPECESEPRGDIIKVDPNQELAEELKVLSGNK